MEEAGPTTTLRLPSEAGCLETRAGVQAGYWAELHTSPRSIGRLEEQGCPQEPELQSAVRKGEWVAPLVAESWTRNPATLAGGQQLNDQPLGAWDSASSVRRQTTWEGL